VGSSQRRSDDEHSELEVIWIRDGIVKFAGRAERRHRRSACVRLSGRQVPRFPPDLEPKINAAIQEQLHKLDAGFGYSAAACGSDILFCEAMLERDREIHIVLPYEKERFIEASVDRAPGWRTRFERILERAADVVVASGHQIDGGSASRAGTELCRGDESVRDGQHSESEYFIGQRNNSTAALGTDANTVLIPDANAAQKPNAKPTQSNAPSEPAPKIPGSMVGYIDNPIVQSQIRIRFDDAFEDRFPDRSEFFYGQVHLLSTPSRCSFTGEPCLRSECARTRTGRSQSRKLPATLSQC
jgi:hypothetical protein